MPKGRTDLRECPGARLNARQWLTVSIALVVVAWPSLVALATAATAERIAIVRQPVGSTNLIGDNVVLSVEVTGSPVIFQWWKQSVPIQRATNSSYTIAPGGPIHAGDYFLVAANAAGSVTSTVARVEFHPDLVGPVAMSATVRLDMITIGNVVDLVFNEAARAPATITNISVIHRRTGNVVPITNSMFSGRTGRLRLLGNEHWRPFDDYFVSMSEISDQRGNLIAPNSRVPLSWPRLLGRVVSAGNTWRFHNSAIFEPDIYAQAWMGTNFLESHLWGSGAGLFHQFTVGFDSCFGWVGPEGLGGGFESGINIGFQPEPYLFRTTFSWPATNGPNATLFARLLVDDGVVIYLNGEEIYRYNTPAGPVTRLTQAVSPIGVPACFTNSSISVTNLLGGTNWLAVALTQVASASDACFAMELDAQYLQTPALPVEPVPSIAQTPLAAGIHRLAWDTGGYALESTTNLGNPLSYPRGPWIEVSNMANPFIIQSTNRPGRFYRLKRK